MRFLSRSVLILLALYGLVFALGDAYLVHLGASTWLLVAFPIGMVIFQYLIGPSMIEWLLDIGWGPTPQLLPAVNAQFVEKVCAERGVQVPRIGIIYSGTPNAFCFGHYPGDARLVVTQGLLDVLTPEETNAVLAHELGHIEHWDFVVMTLASLAPLLLYQVYVVSQGIKNLRAVAYSAYLCYWVSQYVVLLLNRTREAYADHHSAQITGAPDQLASALIKIAYGMARGEGEYRQSLERGYKKDDKKEVQRQRRLAGAIGVMGISSLGAGRSLALAAANPAQAAAVMRWDVVNPWARIYELGSSHPLTAIRVRELNRDAETMHQPIHYPLPESGGRHWDGFPLEVFLWAAPVVLLAMLGATVWAPDFLAFLHIGLPPATKAILLMLASVLWMVRTLFRYHGEFEDSTIGTLIEDVEVSQMRPRAVRIKGEIVGKGVPGFFWSTDLVLRDPSGIIFLLYRQTIPLAKYFFAPAAEKLIGEEVEVEGWFRRGLAPYVEMSCLIEKYGQRHYAYSRWVQHALAAVGLVVGWIWLRAF